MFLVNLPVMIGLLGVGPRFLPEFRDVGAGPADPASAILSIVLGSLAMAVYRPRIDLALPPGLPAHDADTARDTLAGAVEVADRLPHDAAVRLRDAAESAFVAGLHIAAAIGAVASIVLAAFVLTVGRRALPRSEGKDFGHDFDRNPFPRDIQEDDNDKAEADR